MGKKYRDFLKQAKKENRDITKELLQNNTHKKARDFFCFGCLTGLRYIDLAQLTKDNIVDGAIKITTQNRQRGYDLNFPRATNHYRPLP